MLPSAADYFHTVRHPSTPRQPAAKVMMLSSATDYFYTSIQRGFEPRSLVW